MLLYFHSKVAKIKGSSNTNFVHSSAQIHLPSLDQSSVSIFKQSIIKFHFFINLLIVLQVRGTPISKQTRR